VLAPDLSTSGVRRTRGWHASVGVWIALGMFFLSATGLTWSHYAGDNFGALRTTMKSDAPTLDTTLPGAAPAAPTPEDGGHHGGPTATPASLPAGVGIDRILASARANGLHGPVEISLPADAASTWVVAQTDNTCPVRLDSAALSPATGDVTARTTWADYSLLAKASKLGVQAHMGILFGLINQLLLAALALGLLCVIVWGYRMWWQRRPTRDGQRKLVGKPPARGIWRQIPVPALILGLPVVAAIGWAIPLFGITLAGFLLLDLLLGAARRTRPGRDAPVSPALPPATDLAARTAAAAHISKENQP
jgi:uncharacterized iron-regulated membrane protein